MKQLFLDIEARILAAVPEVTFVQPYNQQFEDMEDGQVYSFPLPAVFIEFLNPSEILQLGNGVQSYDPLDIKIHIAHQKYNDLNGNQERNLEVFDLKQSVFMALNKFMPTNAGAMVRIEEEQDYNHSNLYHYTQTYRTTLIDASAKEPVGGITTTGPITVIIQKDVIIENDIIRTGSL